MAVAQEFAEANGSYVQSFADKGSLGLPPSRKVIVLTCMDARIDPAASLGIKEGEAHIIRNAGGRASDALRSVVISQQLLGTREIVVFHHTDCGMLTFSDDALRNKLKDGASAAIVPLVDSFAFLPFGNLEESVKEDVAYLKANPLVLPSTPISGWIYDVHSGKVTQVV